MSPVDFGSDDSIALLNPRMAASDAEALRSRLSVVDGLTSHVFLLTSGSTGTSAADFKWVALAKTAILAAAESSNRFLDSNSRDVWFHGLPSFHIGGLSIWARAELSGAKVQEPTYERWDAAQFVLEATDCSATLCSLVPTQVYDLVQLGVKSPPSLRAILVGGGALSEGLYYAARELGWPLLPTYGMTETCSQVATQPPAGPHQLEVLPHLEVGTTSNGAIRVRGASLLTGYVIDGPDFVDPKDAEGWFATDDLGTVDGCVLTLMGRARDRIKIGGELSNLAVLRRVFDEEAHRASVAADYALLAIPDERLGQVVVVATTQDEPNLTLATRAFADRVMPFERIRATIVVPEIPRTPLGKVRWEALAALVLTR